MTKFNHKLHAGLGNVAPAISKAVADVTYLSPVSKDLTEALAGAKHACAACHRGMEVSERLDGASPAHFPAMADCLVCHTDIDPPFSCTKCHEDGARLKPATHTPDWVDLHSSGKARLDKPSCAVCHGRKFTCLGCH